MLAACLSASLLAGIPLASQSTPSKAPVTVADLMTPAKNQKLIGRQVTLWYQPVQVKTRSNALWVGPDQDHMVLVTIPPTVHALNADGKPVDLDEGDRVQVSGLVVTAPNDYQLKKGWGVNEDDLFLAQRSGIIMMADSIKLIAERD